MKLKGEALFFVGIIAVSILVVGGAIFLGGESNKPVEEQDLVTDDSYSKGPANASATIVEFSDFQCPACRSAFPILERITEQYKDDLRFVYRHFPLPSHKNSKVAAEAAESAGAQGKFWEFHDILFERQNSWGDSGQPEKIFISYAEELELDTDKFQKDLKEHTFLPKINADIKAGNNAGVSSTPTFFLNGEKLPGVPVEEVLKGKIEELISK